MTLRSHTPDKPQVLQQALTFMLGAETYAVDVLRVQEIKVWSQVTPIPRAPSSVLGVLNLRGTIVPVVDLRRLLDLTPADFRPQTVIIVISVQAADQRTLSVGVVVDRVSEVVDARSTDLRPAPEVGAADSSSLLGILTLPEGLVQWLDIDRLVESGLLTSAAALPPAGAREPAPLEH